MSDATEMERKLQRIDFESLSERHQVIVVDRSSLPATELRHSVQRAVTGGSGSPVVHIYAGRSLPRRDFVGFPFPYVSSIAPPSRRFTWRKPLQPALLVSPLGVEGAELLPEAVNSSFFTAAEGVPRDPHGPRWNLGTFGPHRPGVIVAIEQTLSRIHRFRTDVDWNVFDQPPTPSDLAHVDAWIDPGTDPNDMDGFAAEALVLAKPVVATRSPINTLRLEQGRSGWLVPAGDPNELTHAILAALFKPEVARIKTEAARQTGGKFRPRQRLRVLERIYETLLP